MCHRPSSIALLTCESVGAARTIPEIVCKLRELTDLEERISVLEEKLKHAG
jgi:hypothetical protein